MNLTQLSPPLLLEYSSVPSRGSLLNECHIQLLYNERLSQWVSDSDAVVAVDVVAVDVAAVFVAVLGAAVVVAAAGVSENQFRA